MSAIAAPPRDPDGLWHEVATKFNGKHWYVLLEGRGRNRNLASINRHIEGEWEMFEHGAYADIEVVWLSLKDVNAPVVVAAKPEIEWEEAGDLLDEAEIIPAEPPVDPYAALPNYGRF
jgi:hypothetical protein